jgi:hypothetical protein
VAPASSELGIGQLRACDLTESTTLPPRYPSVLQTRRELLRAAYLVDRGAVGEFVARVRQLQRAHEELALVCTGPWPPFSFAQGAPEA